MTIAGVKADVSWVDTNQVTINGTKGIGKNQSLCIVVGGQSGDGSCVPIDFAGMHRAYNVYSSASLTSFLSQVRL